MKQIPASRACRIAGWISGFVSLFCIWAVGQTWTLPLPLLLAAADFRG